METNVLINWTAFLDRLSTRLAFFIEAHSRKRCGIVFIYYYLFIYLFFIVLLRIYLGSVDQLN